MLSGIIYFFAFNWTKIPVWVKLSSIEAAIVILASTAFMLGLKRAGGRVSLLAASVMVGVFLAVFGQIYQTGADAYQLFTSWAALIFLWVLVSRFAALWVLWAAVLNTGIITYWVQMISYSEETFYWVFPICLSLNALLLALREGFAENRRWLSGTWHRYVLASAVLVFADIPVFVYILDNRHLPVLTGSLLGLAANLYLVFHFSRRKPDPAALFLGILSLCFIGEVAMGKFVFRLGSHAGTLFVAGVLTLGIFSAGVALFRRLNRTEGH